LYVLQIEQKKPEPEEAIEVHAEDEHVEVEIERWIGLKKFFKKNILLKKNNKKKL
jgi:hypothetical protein